MQQQVTLTASGTKSIPNHDLNLILNLILNADPPVSGAMTPFLTSLSPSATMQEAAALMLRRNLNRVLILDPMTGCLIGMVSISDIFRLAFEGCDPESCDAWS